MYNNANNISVNKAQNINIWLLVVIYDDKPGLKLAIRNKLSVGFY